MSTTDTNPRHTLWLRTVLAASAVLAAGCVSLHRAPSYGQPPAQTAYTLWVGPFAVRTLEPLDEDGVEARALREVADEVDAILGSRPVHDPIEVFLFSDRGRYEQFLAAHRGKLPYRRALFVREGARRKVYAYRSSRIARDLKHEAAHALLSVRAGTIPLWLDEGLAEYFEPPTEDRHLQPDHVRELIRLYDHRLWRPDLERLAAIDHVADFTRRDYAEAWLWCHLLLEGSETTRREVVAAIERDGGRSLPQRLALMAENWPNRVLEHLAGLRVLCEQLER